MIGLHEMVLLAIEYSELDSVKREQHQYTKYRIMKRENQQALRRVARDFVDLLIEYVASQTFWAWNANIVPLIRRIADGTGSAVDSVTFKHNNAGARVYLSKTSVS